MTVRMRTDSPLARWCSCRAGRASSRSPAHRCRHDAAGTSPLPGYCLHTRTYVTMETRKNFVRYCRLALFIACLAQYYIVHVHNAHKNGALMYVHVYVHVHAAAYLRRCRRSPCRWRGRPRCSAGRGGACACAAPGRGAPCSRSESTPRRYADPADSDTAPRRPCNTFAWCVMTVVPCKQLQVRTFVRGQIL